MLIVRARATTRVPRPRIKHIPPRNSVRVAAQALRRGYGRPRVANHVAKPFTPAGLVLRNPTLPRPLVKIHTPKATRATNIARWRSQSGHDYNKVPSTGLPPAEWNGIIM